MDKQCKLCPSTIGYLTTDNLIDGICACDSSKDFSWDTASLTCKCKLDYFLTSTNTCIKCPSTAGYLSSTEINNVCLCDTTKNFAWDATSRTCKCRSGFTVLAADSTCYCNNGFFLNEVNNCLTCAGMTGILTPAASVKGECKCDGTKNFIWSSDLSKCICKDKFYLSSTNACVTCVGMLGTETGASSTNGQCNCDTGNNFEWSSSSRSCSCQAGYYKNTTSKSCISCGSKTSIECSCEAEKFE